MSDRTLQHHGVHYVGDGCAPENHVSDAFLCDHCGACCKKQRWTFNAEDHMAHVGTFGMLLFPGEERLFARTEPLWRSGSEVLAWQTVDEPCEHWHGLRCSIYKRRPQTCRAFPVWWELVWRADTNCPVVAAGPKLANFPEQTLAAHLVRRFLAWVIGTHQDLEYFDLAERRWICLRSTPTATAR